MTSTDVSSTAGTSSSSSDTTDGPADAVTGPPPDPFCIEQDMNGALACEDFDAEDGFGWTAIEADGFVRMPISGMNPLSPTMFMRSISDGPNPDGPAQALFEATPPALQSDRDGFEVSFGIRLPADLGAACGTAQLRVFEIQYMDAGLVNIVMELGPDGLRGFLFRPSMTPETLFSGLAIPDLMTSGWHEIRVGLIRGAGGYRLQVLGDDAVFEVVLLDEFAPPGGAVSINVGPWFDTNNAPQAGCFYDLDNLAMRESAGS